MTQVYSTDGIAPDRRAEFWTNFVEENFGEQVQFGPDATAENFEARVTHTPHNAFDVFQSDIPFENHTSGMRDRSGDFLLQLTMQIEGTSRFAHAGSKAATRTGDIVVLDGSQDYEVLASAGRCAYITLPYRSNPTLLSRLRDVAGMRIDGNHSAGAVISKFMLGFLENVDRVPPSVADRLLHSLIDTLNTAAAAQLGKSGPNRGAQRRFLLRKLRLFVEEHLRDPNLSPQSIADRHGISRRYLNKLFEDEPLTVTQLIWERRLAHARRAVTDPAQAHISLTEIAYQCGFSSSAHFSRAFKARFGVTPTQARSLRAAS